MKLPVRSAGVVRTITGIPVAVGATRAVLPQLYGFSGCCFWGLWDCPKLEWPYVDRRRCCYLSTESAPYSGSLYCFCPS